MRYTKAKTVVDTVFAFVYLFAIASSGNRENGVYLQQFLDFKLGRKRTERKVATKGIINHSIAVAKKRQWNSRAKK